MGETREIALALRKMPCATLSPRLDSFPEAYQSADALWYAEVPSYDYQVFNLNIERIRYFYELPAACRGETDR
jgi:hypothetical protein